MMVAIQVTTIGLLLLTMNTTTKTTRDHVKVWGGDHNTHYGGARGQQQSTQVTP
jgi:hypothetical protein